MLNFYILRSKMVNWITAIDSWLFEKGIYLALKEILEHWLFKLFVVALTAINAYILLIIGSDADADKFKTNFKFLADILFNNTGTIVSLSMAVTGMYVFLKDFLNNRCENIQQKYIDLDSKYDIAVKILVQLNDVVAKKRQLLADTTRDHLNTPQAPSAKTIFTKIIQPKAQIDKLIEALRDCLLAIYKGDTIKVVLVGVKDSSLDGWVSHTPYDMGPKTDISVLRNESSTLSRCIQTGKMVIVPNTQIEIQKQDNADKMFVQGKTNPLEKWCQVCAPIHSINNPNEIIYIVSIAIKRENAIQEENAAFLGWMLDFFKTRLALEHSHMQLKGRVK